MERFLERTSLSKYRDQFVLKGGLRFAMEAYPDGSVTPLKIDVSTRDAITPREILYSYKLMFEDIDSAGLSRGDGFRLPAAY